MRAHFNFYSFPVTRELLPNKNVKFVFAMQLFQIHWLCVCIIVIVCPPTASVVGETAQEQTKQISSRIICWRWLSGVPTLSCLMLSDQILRYSDHSCLPSTVSCMVILQSLLCHVTWPNHNIFQRLIPEICQITRPLTLFQFIGFLLPVDVVELFSSKLFSKAWIFFCSNQEYPNLTPVEENRYDR